MKTILKYIGVGALGIVLFFVSMSVITLVNKPNNEEVFIPYIRDSIPKFTTWQYKEYEALMSPDGLSSANKDQWQKYLKLISRLGKYQSYSLPTLESSKTMLTTKNGAITYAVYLVPIKFDTGDAHIRLTLQYNDKKVQTVGIKFLSDLLLE